MGAWGKEHKADDKVVMLGDGSGEFTEAIGLDRRPHRGRDGHPLAALFDAGR